jgi:hypothetical protein
MSILNAVFVSVVRRFPSVHDRATVLFVMLSAFGGQAGVATMQFASFGYRMIEQVAKVEIKATLSHVIASSSPSLENQFARAEDVGMYHACWSWNVPCGMT